jgi:hypothetical protein
VAAKVHLSALGAFFATRGQAQEIRHTIEALPEGQRAVIDWAGVAGITGAFADELAGKLSYGPRDVTHTGMSVAVRETVELALRRRGVTAA